MNKIKLIISMVVLAIVVAGATVFMCLNRNISTTDAVIESEMVAVNAQENGKVTNVFVKPDQNITVGQLIAEIEVQQTISPAQVKADSVQISKKKLQEAEENHTDLAMMYKDGVVSQEEYDDSLQKLETARTSLNNAENANQVKPAVTLITKKIYAPQDGVVSVTYVDRGEAAVKDKPILLLNTDNPKIVAYFNPKYKDELRAGRNVSVKLSQYKGKTFEGMIEASATEPEMQADKKTLVLPVTIVFKSDISGYSFDKNSAISVSLK